MRNVFRKKRLNMLLISHFIDANDFILENIYYAWTLSWWKIADSKNGYGH